MSSINSVHSASLLNQLQQAQNQQAARGNDPDRDGDTDKPGAVDQDAGKSSQQVSNTQNGLDVTG